MLRSGDLSWRRPRRPVIGCVGTGGVTYLQRMLAEADLLFQLAACWGVVAGLVVITVRGSMAVATFPCTVSRKLVQTRA